MFNFAQTVYIVAGGPSLTNFDWDWLTGKAVVAVNESHLKVPKARMLWWSDWRYWQYRGYSLRCHRAPLKCTIVDSHRRTYPEWVTVWKNDGLLGLSMLPGHVRHGNNSGYAAINAAVQLGARRIVLLGYDFYITPEREHWHSPHPWGDMRQRTLTEKMLPHFGRLAADLGAVGVEVLNANRGSALHVFQFTSEVPNYG
jgi:hypothetical protein